MIPIQSNTNSLETGALEATTFSIEANSMAYEILFKGVYTNPLAAVIREISCNAVDAFTEHGLSDIRWDAHAPTILEPYFAIRDYAVGLSPEDMSNLYTTMFASTKRGSNSSTGMMGIGRMSPLAYTSSFTVTSWHKGLKSQYLVSTDSGIPKLVQMSSVESSEPSGLEVKVAVRPSDISRFVREMQKQYYYYSAQPTSNITIDYTEEPVVLTGSTWAIHGGQGSAVIVAGNVAYHIPNALATYGTDNYNILNANLRIMAEVGEFAFDAGRENLQLDDTSKAYILKRLAQIKEEITANILGKLEGTTPWEKLTSFQTLSSSVGQSLVRSLDLSAILPNVTQTLSWHGSDLRIGLRHLPDGASISELRPGRVTSRVAEYVRVGEKLMVMDIRIGANAAALAYRDSLATKHSVYILRAPTFPKDYAVWAKDVLPKMLGYLGNPEYVLASDHVPTTTVTTNGLVKEDFYLIHKTDETYSRFRNVQYFTKSPDVKFFYYLTSKSSPVMDKDLLAACHAVLQPAYKDEAVHCVGVPKSKQALIKSDSRFIPIEEAARQEAPLHAYYDYEYDEKIRSIMLIPYKQVSKQDWFSKECDVWKDVKLAEDHDTANLLPSKTLDLQRMKEHFGVKTHRPPYSVDWEKFHEIYPVFKSIQSYNHKAKTQYCLLQEQYNKCKEK